MLSFQDILFILKLLICKRNRFEQKKFSFYCPKFCASFHKFCYCATFAAVEVSGEKAIVSVQGRERERQVHRNPKVRVRTLGNSQNFLKKSKNQFPVLV